MNGHSKTVQRSSNGGLSAPGRRTFVPRVATSVNEDGSAKRGSGKLPPLNAEVPRGKRNGERKGGLSFQSL